MAHPTAAPPKSDRRSVRRLLVSGAVGASITGISSVVGIAQIPWPWLGLQSLVLAGLGFSVSNAVTVKKPREQVFWWRLCLGLALLLPLGGLVYHTWFDPAERTPRTYQYVVNGAETNCIALYGEAGGEPQVLETGEACQNGLIGGQAYEFDCAIVLNSPNDVWLRYHRGGRTWWAPLSFLHQPIGIHQPPIPSC